MQEQLVTTHATAAVAAAVAHGGDGWMGFLLVVCANIHFAPSSRDVKDFSSCMHTAVGCSSTFLHPPARRVPGGPLSGHPYWCPLCDGALSKLVQCTMCAAGVCFSLTHAQCSSWHHTRGTKLCTVQVGETEANVPHRARSAEKVSLRETVMSLSCDISATHADKRARLVVM
jgi:hypothetical protein